MRLKALSLIIILLLGLTGIADGKVVAVFKELMQPNRFYLDQENIYITERTTIFIYSLKDFRLIRKFGKQGEGPGEFKNPLFIVPLKKRLLINSLGKISYYTKEGILQKEIKNETSYSNFYPLSNGFAGIDNIARRGSMYFTVNLFDFDLEKGRQIYSQKIEIQQAGKIELFRRAFMCKTYKDRVFITGKDGFIVDCLDNTGKLLYTIRRLDFKKHKIDAEDIKNANKYFKLRYGEQYEQIKNRLHYPEFFPEIRAFYLTDDKLYILSYEWRNDALKFYIYTIDGESLNDQYLSFKMKYSMQPYPFGILNNQLYQLIENESSEEWELHINKIDFN